MQFNSVPAQNRVPFTFVEFSNSQASSSSVVQPYSLLLLGQKQTVGTQPVSTLIRVSSKKQANTLFGAGSMLAAMFRKAYDANNFTPIFAVAIADDAAGVTAKSTMVVTGPASADGTVALYIGGKAINIGVLSGDTATAIGAKIETAINADTELFVTALATIGSVALEANHKGLVYNSGPVEINFYGESLPVGVTMTTPALTGGTTNPSIADAITAMAEDQYRTIVTPYLDAANLVLIEAELARRWGPLAPIDGHAFSATQVNSAAAAAIGMGRNSPHLTILENYGSPTPAWETAAILGATVSFESPIDQARPLQTVVLNGVLPPKPKDRLIFAERNVLLYSGISTTTVDSGGLVRIERLITTHKQDSTGNIDESYLDYEKLAILSYLRFDFRNFFGRKYPRHKLAKDGTRFAPGASIMTPKLAKAEAIGLFANWEQLGLVEDAASFEAGLIAEINVLNPERLDMYLPPNLIGALRILAAQIAFRS